MNFLKISRSATLSVAVGLASVSSGFASDEINPVAAESRSAVEPCYVELNVDQIDQQSDLPTASDDTDRDSTAVEKASRPETRHRSKSVLSQKSLCCHRYSYGPQQMPMPMPRPMPQPRPAYPPQSYAPAPYPQPYPPAAYSAPPAYAPAPAPAPAYAPAPAPAALAASPPPAAPVPAGPIGDVVLTNAEAGAISYTINGTRYDMDAGYTQKLANRSSWTIEFDRGTGQGNVRYTLTPGSYHFTATESGWNLTKQDDTPAAPTPLVAKSVPTNTLPVAARSVPVNVLPVSAKLVPSPTKSAPVITKSAPAPVKAASHSDNQALARK